ncbi:hypothetical protein LCGC14_1225160 [marine sediment metagenome]|uniref:Uncharacterized protein n=1 Tax=marine sediment metagenome TaxID=412755 RepID=A0A0F9PEL8_9ZZZZ
MPNSDSAPAPLAGFKVTVSLCANTGPPERVDATFDVKAPTIVMAYSIIRELLIRMSEFPRDPDAKS